MYFVKYQDPKFLKQSLLDMKKKQGVPTHRSEVQSAQPACWSMV